MLWTHAVMLSVLENFKEPPPHSVYNYILPTTGFSNKNYSVVPVLDP